MSWIHVVRSVLGPGLCLTGLGGEMGLARPDLAQALARSGLDLFILVQIKSYNFFICIRIERYRISLFWCNKQWTSWALLGVRHLG